MKYTMTLRELRKYYNYHGDNIIRISFSCDYKYDDGKGCEYNTPSKVYGNFNHYDTMKIYCRTHAIKMIETGQITKRGK